MSSPFNVKIKQYTHGRTKAQQWKIRSQHLARLGDGGSPNERVFTTREDAVACYEKLKLLADPEYAERMIQADADACMEHLKLLSSVPDPETAACIEHLIQAADLIYARIVDTIEAGGDYDMKDLISVLEVAKNIACIKKCA